MPSNKSPLYPKLSEQFRETIVDMVQPLKPSPQQLSEIFFGWSDYFRGMRILPENETHEFDLIMRARVSCSRISLIAPKMPLLPSGPLDIVQTSTTALEKRMLNAFLINIEATWRRQEEVQVNVAVALDLLPALREEFSERSAYGPLIANKHQWYTFWEKYQATRPLEKFGLLLELLHGYEAKPDPNHIDRLIINRSNSSWLGAPWTTVTLRYPTATT